MKNASRWAQNMIVSIRQRASHNDRLRVGTLVHKKVRVKVSREVEDDLWPRFFGSESPRMFRLRADTVWRFREMGIHAEH